MTTVVPVELADRAYDVWVGRGVRGRLADVLPPQARRAAIVSQEAIAATWPVDTGLEQETFLIGDGEQHKSLTTIEQLCSQFSRFGLTRDDLVVGLGGGLVTDVAGFAAASFHRGTPVLHVSTSMIGQVDAAIGGKTGVNLPEGKNLVGAFWQPVAVLCDLETLTTLPEAEVRSGLGEVAKYHFLADRPEFMMDPSHSLDERVARSVALKAAVVAGDERESTAAPVGARSRAILNYGHTLAHALESHGSYGLRHGEAVAVGLAFAARLAANLDRISDARVAEHDRVLDAYGLGRRLPMTADPEQLIRFMARDKKAVHGLTFVLDGVNGVELVHAVPVDVVRTTLEEMETQ